MSDYFERIQLDEGVAVMQIRHRSGWPKDRSGVIAAKWEETGEPVDAETLADLQATWEEATA